MDLARVNNYLLSKPGVVETYPFGPDTQVFKVAGKICAIAGVHNGREQCNLKCDPAEAIELRDLFPAIVPGYHMNKKHWNTVLLDGSVPEGELMRMIDNSYDLVLASLSKKQRLLVLGQSLRGDAV